MARSRRRRQANAIPIILGIVGLLVLSMAIVGVYIWLSVKASSNPSLDQASLCPRSGPTSETAILLDVTDPISDTTTLDLRNQFQKIVSEVPIGGSIQVYALTEKEGELQQTFSGCNPGNGDNVDVWTSNPRLAQARWEKGFQKPLDDISKKLNQGDAGRQSPIMAGIQRINLLAFGSTPKQVPKNLFVASDMIEHTQAFSNYRDGVAYAKFLQSPARDKFRTSLDGVSIKILAFQRPNMKFTMEALADFWASWISSNNGYFAGFVRLEGIR
jgi:hypothetical protein